MKVSKSVFSLFLHFSFIILTTCSECDLKNDESCKSLSAIKGLMHMVEGVSVTLSEILSSAKFRTNTLEENLCINYLAPTGVANSGDNDHCVSAKEDCLALYEFGFRKSGPYRIWPKYLNHSIIIYCDMETDGGGWSVIQRRGTFNSPHVDFFRNWVDYKHGFGNIEEEFWLGNDYIFAMTNSDKSLLRVDLETFEGEQRYAKYRDFLVRSEIEKYRMTIGEYDGTAGDGLRFSNGADFHTKDRGNNCPPDYKGAWWYRASNACHESNLNGLYLQGNHSTFADGINWKPFKGFYYSMAKTDMKIRRCKC